MRAPPPGDVQLWRIFSNQLGNAITYRRQDDAPGCAGSAKRTGAMVPFAVRESGIEEGYHGRIFEAYCRLHTTELYEGAGIGLAIVTRIVKGHVGRCRAASVAGAGSMVIFSMQEK
jgi:light-regulated signal transduction histidine kinase (bacteriophytochrome)